MRKVWSVLAVVACGAGLAVAADVPDIDEIMKVINGKGKKSLHNTVGAELKSAEPKWDEVTKKTKVYAELAAALGKNKVPSGDEKSWMKLCGEYAAQAKALDVAAGKKDKDAALAAWSKLHEGCKACHDAHR